MTLQFYNTLTHKKEQFSPINDGEVKIYCCGPTVYNYVHIGNLRAYIFNDILRRYLKYKGFKLNHVMNITDVDDKTIRDSQKEGKSLKEFTEFYTEEFLKDLKTLKIEIPETMPKATETVPEMVELIETLKGKGLTYEHDGDIYFSIEKFDGYGKMANLDVEGLKNNADSRLDNGDEYTKENPRDFALWKKYDKKDGDVFWETSIGKGRPGWHIECSAMSRKFLGQPFDIHTGGVDLVFPHHTNEIAQSEAAYGTKFCNMFLHNEHLMVNSEKMSKSLGNFYTLRDLIDKGYSPLAIRYVLMSTHYRQQLNFTEDAVKQVPNTLSKIYDFLDKLSEVKGDGAEVDTAIETALQKFEHSMDDDLNVSGALAAMFEFMTEINKVMDELSANDAVKVKDVMTKFDTVFAVMEHTKDEAPSEVVDMAKKRVQARAEKDWAESDRLRDDILAKGYVVEDKKDGYRLKKQ